MRGHEDLLALRQRRRIPARGVMVEVTTTPPWQVGLLREPWVADDPDFVDADTVLLTVDPSESIDRLDLRCLVDLKVLVFAHHHEPNERAIRALCMACVNGGARRVMGFQLMAGVPIDELPESHRLFDFTREQ
jgi:hypothetical protein